MTHFAGTPFGLGNPTNYSIPAVPWGVSPYTSPFSSQPIAGYGINPGQQLQFIQQQQSQLLQLLLQTVPAQLQQLQQLIQIVPQQVHQLQQQPFGASSGQLGFGFAPQVFGGQAAGQVM